MKIHVSVHVHVHGTLATFVCTCICKLVVKKPRLNTAQTSRYKINNSDIWLPRLENWDSRRSFMANATHIHTLTSQLHTHAATCISSSSLACWYYCSCTATGSSPDLLNLNMRTQPSLHSSTQLDANLITWGLAVMWLRGPIREWELHSNCPLQCTVSVVLYLVHCTLYVYMYTHIIMHVHVHIHITL